MLYEVITKLLPDLLTESAGRHTGRHTLPRMKPLQLMTKRLRTLLGQSLIGILLAGCASLERYPDNPPLERFDRQSSLTGLREQGKGDTLLIVTFSGGGTRAAALAYGVLEVV